MLCTDTIITFIKGIRLEYDAVMSCHDTLYRITFPDRAVFWILPSCIWALE